MRTRQRQDNLDLLKAIAILMVLSLHVPLWNVDFIGTPSLGRALQYWESTEALDAETGKFRGLTAGGHTVDYGAGADAALVGEALMRAADRAAMLAALRRPV